MAIMAKLNLELPTPRTLVPSTPAPTPSSTSPPSLPRRRRPSLSISIPTSTTTTISLLALFPLPSHAKSLSLKEEILSSLTQVEETLDQVEEVSSGVFDTAQRLFQALSDALKPALDTALPVVRQTADKALQVASPAFSEASNKAQQALQSSGLDTQPILSAAKTVADAAQQTANVIEGAKPIASTTVETIASADPIDIVVIAEVIFFAYILLPRVWSFVSFNLRGYKAELTPAQTLDLLCTQNYILVDIRSEKDKNKAGIPRLPSSAKTKMVSIPLEELPSKIRGLVRNAKKVEAEIAALKISYLKKVNKGTNIVIMDSYSDSAKIVARTLTKLGLKQCYTVTDGFSGNRGWLQSRLGTDSYSVSFAEILSPSRVIPAAVSRFGTTSGKLLPGAD